MLNIIEISQTDWPLSKYEDKINNRICWIKSRPISYFGFNRIKDAYYVLIGKAEAVKWPDK